MNTYKEVFQLPWCRLYPRLKVCFEGAKCSYCDCKLTQQNFTRDHVVPHSKMRKFKFNLLRSELNITPCCRDCNNKKGIKSLFSFLGLLEV